MILYIKIVIDRILKQAVDKDNKIENLANFNRSAGVRESLNENLIPEQLFDDPNTKEKEAEGISAVKALQIASKEGQTIYTINQDNYSQILPKLNHSSDVMRDVANAVNAGREVVISERQIRAFGWSGTGFIVLDPYTGYGAYLIDGGNNGGWTDIKIPSIVLFFIGIFLTAGILSFFSPILTGITLITGGSLLIGCTLSNIYNSDSPATWSLYLTGLVLGAIAFIKGISVRQAWSLFGIGAGVAFPPFGSWFTKECKNA